MPVCEELNKETRTPVSTEVLCRSPGKLDYDVIGISNQFSHFIAGIYPSPLLESRHRFSDLLEMLQETLVVVRLVDNHLRGE